MSPSNNIGLLVRAFTAAWERYFQAGSDGRVSKSLARPALSEFLVSKFREGVDDEPGLAAAGLEFLFSLEDAQNEPIDNEPIDTDFQPLHLENAGARFIPVGRIQWYSKKTAADPTNNGPAAFPTTMDS